MKQIITVQHTQAENHINGMVGSWTEWGLTNLGRHQAAVIAENLTRQLQGKTVKLYCSSQVRARETAAPIAELLGIDVEYREELREQGLGEAVGQSVQWMNERARQVNTVDDRVFPSAESLREVWQRLLSFSKEILTVPEEVVICVSHGVTLSVWNSLWLSLEPESLLHCTLKGSAGGVSIFGLGEQGQRYIYRMGDRSYLVEQGATNEIRG